MLIPEFGELMEEIMAVFEAHGFDRDDLMIGPENPGDVTGGPGCA